MTLTPMEEVSKRFGEVVPGLKSAAGAVGLESHRQMLHDYAARVRHDYKFQQSLLGDTIEDDEMPEEPMGDIIITGDLNFGGNTSAEQAIKALKGKVVDKTDKGAPPAATTEQPATPTVTPAPATTTPTAEVKPGMSPLLKTGLILGAGLLAGGGLGGLTVAALINKATTVIHPAEQDTDTNSILHFEEK